jgi:hypothetical protein
MQITQIQEEIIGTAHAEGRVDPSTFSRLLLHDFDDVHAAIRDLSEAASALSRPARDERVSREEWKQRERHPESRTALIQS